MFNPKNFYKKIVDFFEICYNRFGDKMEYLFGLLGLVILVALILGGRDRSCLLFGLILGILFSIASMTSPPDLTLNQLIDQLENGAPKVPMIAFILLFLINIGSCMAAFKLCNYIDSDSKIGYFISWMICAQFFMFVGGYAIAMAFQLPTPFSP